ncbi:uncharacterized protein LOC143022635 [Oratosquilla oratoria]|uniref:uncharacterized protein LOC143022635 n=1 Tax=Oratosquilla oratoria TaxID=337810 RepID=UPI003F766D7C
MEQFPDLPTAYNAFRILLKAINAKASITVQTKLYKSPMQVMLRLAQPPHAATLNEYGNPPPLLLHPKCPLWSRIILHQHRLALHTNTATLHVILRRDYWVSRQRQTIKSRLRQCLHCRRIQTPPFKFPTPTRVHPNRIHFHAPFSTTGVDFLGAIKLRQSHVDAAYVVVFTCASIRALILEVVTSLSVADFLRALRRFPARVGMPHSFVSDNATNLVATDRFLREVKDHPSINDFLTNHHSSWTFITPLAPWQGGMYERLVGITKSNLRKSLYKRTPTYDEFRTMCQEVECVVNNRPLTYVSTEDDTPLTPNHFMYGRTIALFPQVQLTEFSDPDYFIANTLRTQYQFLTDILQTFKRRWSHDYIISLRERHLRHSKPHQRGPRVHDLVLLVLDGVPRDQYPLARVTRVFPGPDDVIRSTHTRTPPRRTKNLLQHFPEEQIEPNAVDNGTKHAAVDPAENTCEHEGFTPHTSQQPSPTTINDTLIETPTVSSTGTAATTSTSIRPSRMAAQQAKNWFTTLDE